MSTPEEIETRIRAENPFFAISEGDTSYIVAPEEFPEWYEEMIEERVGWAVDLDSQQTARAADDQERTIVKQAYNALKNGTATQAQHQRVTAYLLKQIAG